MKMEELKRHRNGDKTFPKSEKVDHCKVTFANRYGITLAGDLYVPKKRLVESCLPSPCAAPFRRGEGTVLRTVCPGDGGPGIHDPGFRSLLYRRERRHAPLMASPDINTEDFQAAVDFLSLHEKADPERIGIIGICGLGRTEPQHRSSRYPHQGHGSHDHVRHEPCQCLRIL